MKGFKFHKSTNIKRMFVIGAGVSASCGLPTTLNLLKEVMRFALNHDRSFTRRIDKFIKYLYPDYESQHEKLPNIENLLNMMDTMTVFNERIRRRRLYSNDDIKQLKKELIIFVCRYLCEQTTQANTAHLCDFVSHLAPHDIILTFNWDFLLERIFEGSGIPLSLRTGYWYYLTKPQAKFTLLKPHGSVNWFKKQEIRLKKGYACSIGKNISVFRRFRYPRIRRNAVPYIIPPSAKKDFGTEDIVRIWKDVYRSLCRSDVIFIIGYSFPKEDLHSRFVFRAALRTNIIRRHKKHKQLRIAVVNPDLSLKSTCRSIIGVDFEFCPKKFEDLVFDKVLFIS